MDKNSERYKKYLEYLRSQQWYNIKIDIIQIRGSRCQKCGEKQPPTKLHVHHITYNNLYNELPEDLMILCAGCHKVEHFPKHKVVVKNKKKKVKRTSNLQKLNMRDRKLQKRYNAIKNKT